jgi:hypothetical protein
MASFPPDPVLASSPVNPLSLDPASAPVVEVAPSLLPWPGGLRVESVASLCELPPL